MPENFVKTLCVKLSKLQNVHPSTNKSVGHFKMEETPSKRPKLDMSSGGEPPFKLVENQNKSKSVVLEDFFVKFPHLTEKIFDHLENTSLAECRKVSGSWQSYLDEQKILQVRIIQSIVGKHQKINESWVKILSLSNTKMIFGLRIMVEKTYTNDAFVFVKADKTCKMKNLSPSPLHVAAANGKLNVYQYFLGKILYVNTRNDMGITPLHLAAQNVHLNVCTFWVLLKTNFQLTNLASHHFMSLH